MSAGVSHIRGLELLHLALDDIELEREMRGPQTEHQRELERERSRRYRERHPEKMEERKEYLREYRKTKKALAAQERTNEDELSQRLEKRK
ncbi:hypothetical protein [Butyricicoccus porcorum]|uniref:Uncharacterized protein n=1 Tax=Butyricicoccus porcorum TaxID=1945634 RepID=A0A252F721_9FIRM|nr:hypothetical protein [Butyricicoccus porcorum]OUM21559.1 hypothetical protein CBW42_03070 [Butyricicoccus porcorum]